MGGTLPPAAIDAGARVTADCCVARLVRSGRRIIGANCDQTLPDGSSRPLFVRADHVFVCAGATQTPALLQRSGIRSNIGRGLKMHPTVKIAARFDSPIDHRDLPIHPAPEFAPALTIGG